MSVIKGTWADCYSVVLPKLLPCSNVYLSRAWILYIVYKWHIVFIITSLYCTLKWRVLCMKNFVEWFPSSSYLPCLNIFFCSFLTLMVHSLVSHQWAACSYSPFSFWLLWNTIWTHAITGQPISVFFNLSAISPWLSCNVQRWEQY